MAYEEPEDLPPPPPSFFDYPGSLQPIAANPSGVYNTPESSRTPSPVGLFRPPPGFVDNPNASPLHAVAVMRQNIQQVLTGDGTWSSVYVPLLHEMFETPHRQAERRALEELYPGILALVREMRTTFPPGEAEPTWHGPDYYVEAYIQEYYLCVPPPLEDIRTPEHSRQMCEPEAFRALPLKRSFGKSRPHSPRHIIMALGPHQFVRDEPRSRGAPRRIQGNIC